MPSKRKPKLDATKEVKRLARERIGTVPPSRVEDHTKPERKQKHRKPLEQLAGDE